MLLEIILSVGFGLIITQSHIQAGRDILGMEYIKPCFIAAVFVLTLAVIEERVRSCSVVILDLGRGQQVGIVAPEKIEISVIQPFIKIIGKISPTIIAGVSVGDSCFVGGVVIMEISPEGIYLDGIGKRPETACFPGHHMGRDLLFSGLFPLPGLPGELFFAGPELAVRRKGAEQGRQ